MIMATDLEYLQKLDNPELTVEQSVTDISTMRIVVSNH